MNIFIALKTKEFSMGDKKKYIRSVTIILSVTLNPVYTIKCSKFLEQCDST